MIPNPHIARMAPYALADLATPPGKPLAQLAQNESGLAPSPAALEAARLALGDARLYPDPDWRDLRAAIAEVHGLDPAGILCGAGSMELIQALAMAWLGPGRHALTTAYGYLFFRSAAMQAGSRTDLAPETDLAVDVDALLAAASPRTAVVFVANPGNPTGTWIDREAVLRLRDGLREDILLVIDEAYGEFADAPGETMFDLVARGDTVVLRTFSKAYGLAGMRVGWGLFPAAVAAEVRKVLNPNNLAAPSQAAATAAMRDQAHMRKIRDQTATRRDRFAAALRQLGLAVPGSHTNFVLARFDSAAAAASAVAALRAEGVLTRAMGGYGLPDCLRITIGGQDEMDRARDLLAAHLQGETTQ